MSPSLFKALLASVLSVSVVHAAGLGSAELFGYEALLSHLQQGFTIRFVVNYELCKPSLGPAIGSNLISDYEWFNDPSYFGPEKLEFSQAKLISNYQGSGFVYDYVKATVFKNDTIVFFASDVNTQDFSPIYEETTVCQLADNKGNGNVHFFYQEVSANPQQLTSFSDIMLALTTGSRIKTFNNYTSCPVYIGPFGKKAPVVTAGQDVATTEYFGGGRFTNIPFFAYSENNLIKNYQGKGFLQDLVEVNVFQNSSVVYRVTVMDAQSYKTLFSEWFLCAIDDGNTVNGIKFFAY